MGSLSLTARVLLVASAAVAAFFGLAGLTLDRAYQRSQEQSLQERLQGHLYALIAAAEPGPEGTVTLPARLPEQRFSQPNSGLYAQIHDHAGQLVWRAPSLRGASLPSIQGLVRNERRFARRSTPDGRGFYVVSFGVAWSEVASPQGVYTFVVAEDVQEFETRVGQFRRSLWSWLGGVAAVLLLVQGAILRWGLRPLQQAANEIRLVEEGRQSMLQGHYPKELLGLTSNLNVLLQQQRERVERYRRALGDLAHSLKTPLAVLQNTLERETDPRAVRDALQQQVARMAQITEYQLQRAAAAGVMAMAAPLPVAATVRKVVASLDKVYADKGVACELHVDEQAPYYGNEGDLMEIVGNLADNAYKWCARRVLVEVVHEGGVSAPTVLRVEDDGPGIPEARLHEVLQRGVRADAQTAGYGIGLAIVADVVELAGGTLRLTRSVLGGVRAEVVLPPRAPPCVA